MVFGLKIVTARELEDWCVEKLQTASQIEANGIGKMEKARATQTISLVSELMRSFGIKTTRISEIRDRNHRIAELNLLKYSTREDYR